jgi:EAL domain-containing protein (putative c-di-GMP-specific phosphodiesterase class I)
MNAAFSTPTPTTRSRADGARLLAVLQEVEARDQDAYAIYAHQSRVSLLGRKHGAMRLAKHEMAAISYDLDALPFFLENGDFVSVFSTMREEQVETAEERMRYLLQGNRDELQAEDEPLVSWFDLSLASDFAKLMSAARVATTAESARESFISDTPRQAFAPREVAELCQTIETRGIAQLVRRQPVVKFSTASIDTLFEEVFVSIPDLKKSFAPLIASFDHPSLFRYITETLDKLILKQIRGWRPPNHINNYSININICSALDSFFENFLIENTEKVPFIVEMQMADIVSAPQAYEEARSYLRRKGIQVALDGIRLCDLPFINLTQFDPDFIKIFWDEEVDAGMSVARSRKLRQLVERIGRDRLILARLESEEALTWAIGAGITRMQGRFIDRLLSTIAKR